MQNAILYSLTATICMGPFVTAEARDDRRDER
jgi:hypothetical protein